MNLIQLTVGQLGVNCYIVSCDDTKESLVIDPGDNIEIILEKIEQENLQVKYIVNTHGHADHIGANNILKNKTNAAIAIHSDDAPMLNNPKLNLSVYIGASIISDSADIILNAGDTITIGNVNLFVLHTPGHTKGGICLLTEGALFSGDTLFAESIGRCDFPDGSMNDLIHSIQSQLMNLPDDVKVYPGHGPVTTIGWERTHNPYL
jgi:glyoxylase-like metal-dependent hydrolase (beta-lactamase superfamily II)